MKDKEAIAPQNGRAGRGNERSSGSNLARQEIHEHTSSISRVSQCKLWTVKPKNAKGKNSGSIKRAQHQDQRRPREESEKKWLNVPRGLNKMS